MSEKKEFTAKDVNAIGKSQNVIWYELIKNNNKNQVLEMIEQYIENAPTRWHKSYWKLRKFDVNDGRVKISQ